MTTNGTAPWPVFRELVELGLRDVRVSIHACDPRTFGRITGAPEAFGAVVDTLRRLVRLRDESVPDLYVMANCTVTDENIGQLPELVDFLVGLDPDDIKLVSVVQWSPERLAELQETYARELLPRLLGLVSPDRHPILRYRLPDLFTRRLRGFVGAEGCAPVSPCCFLMLDDRCVDGADYYPCNIYLRERGRPLGDHREDPAELARDKTLRFVRETDVRTDPICAGCCPDVVREYNAFVWALLRDGDAEPRSRLVC